MSHVQLLSLVFCYGPLIIILPITICGRLSVCLSLCTYKIYHLLFNNADHRLNQTSHTLLMPSNKIMPNYFACCTRKSKQINKNKKHIQFAEFTFTFENFRRSVCTARSRLSISRNKQIYAWAMEPIECNENANEMYNMAITDHDIGSMNLNVGEWTKLNAALLAMIRNSKISVFQTRVQT